MKFDASGPIIAKGFMAVIPRSMDGGGRARLHDFVVIALHGFCLTLAKKPLAKARGGFGLQFAK